MSEVHLLEETKKEQQARKRRFSIRLNVFFFVVFVLFSVLIVKLAILQFVEGQQNVADEIRTRQKPIPIPPIRGNIYDRNGYPIAYSTSTFTLYFRVEKQTKEEVIQVAKDIEKIFADAGDPDSDTLSAKEIIELMEVGYDIHGNTTPISSLLYEPRRIKTGLTRKEIVLLSEYRDELKGIEILEESVRNYDEQKIAVQLIGYLRRFSTANNQKVSYLDYYKDEAITENYLNTENVGFDGLEFMFQEELRGINGMKTYPVNARNQIVGNVSVTNPQKGNNLVLTIDKDLQLFAQQAVADHLEVIRGAVGDRWMHAPNATTGFVVAMEVETGDVVSMVSYPDYDPNVWKGGGISPENYEKNSAFFKNGAISESYPDYKDDQERNKHPTSLVYLGSTMKPLTVLIGLHEKLFRPQDKYNDQGEFFFGRDNSTLPNSGKSRFGMIDAVDALKFSSNTFMGAMIANELYKKYPAEGANIWHDYMNKFGLGVSTESGLPNESRGIADYLNLEQAGSVQAALVYASIGQQGKYTALQLAQYTAMLASRGKRVKPQFVKEIRDYNNELVKTFEPEILNTEEFSDEHWDIIHKGMVEVSIRDNVARWFEGDYPVASKTGTSEQAVAGGDVENAVFIGYAPADQPKIAIAVVVPEGRFGAYGAAPIAAKILDKYDEIYGMYSTPDS